MLNQNDINRIQHFIDYRFKDEDLEEEKIPFYLAILLIKEIIFLNAYWWKKEWTEEQKRITAIFANVNDVFYWACADAEEVLYDEIEDLFEHWEKDNIHGPVVWACKKRNMLPQKPVYDSIMKGGIWNLDEMNLGRNPTWKVKNE